MMEEYVKIVCLLIVIVAAIGGYIAGRHVADVKDQESRPYKWKCLRDDCVFEIEANNMGWAMNIAKVHEETKHDVL